MRSAAAIDDSLAGDPNLTLVGPYGAGEVGVETIRCRKTVYVPAPYAGLLLGADLTPIEAWHRLRGAIVNATAEEACRPLIDWLRAALVRASPDAYSALMVPKPSAPLPDALLLQHRHQPLLIHLPGLDLSINQAAGTCIAETVREVVMELRETRLENKRVREKKEGKGAAEYFRANLAHLLNLVQVTDAKDLSPVFKALVRASKHQQLLVLQRAFNAAAEDIGIHARTIATPSLLKLVLTLGFRMEIRDYLTTGLHPFFLGQHTATVRKFLRGQADRYSMVASVAGAPSLSDVEILSAPNGVTLPRNFLMAHGQWLRTGLIVGTCFGVDHNASEVLREFGKEIFVREAKLGEYLHRDAALLPQIPAVLLWHAQIRWSNWLAAQWGKTSEVPFPDLAGLWTAMENQEPLEPTFPAGYTLSPNAAYGGGMISQPTQGPNHTS